MGFLSGPFLIMNLMQRKFALRRQKREIDRRMLDLTGASSFLYNISNPSPYAQVNPTTIGTWGRHLRNSFQEELNFWNMQIEEQFSTGAGYESAKKQVQQAIASEKGTTWENLAETEKKQYSGQVAQQVTAMVEQQKKMMRENMTYDIAVKREQEISNIERALQEHKEDINTQLQHVEAQIQDLKKNVNQDIKEAYQSTYA